MSTAFTGAEGPRITGPARYEIPRSQVIAVVAFGSAAGVCCLLLGEQPAAVAFPLLALASLIDHHTGRLLDRLTLPALASALLLAGLTDRAPSAASGAAVGLLSGTLLATLRPRSAGLGDAKLLGALGAAIGPEALAAGVAAGSAFALPVALARRGAIHMGPYFTGASLAALVVKRIVWQDAAP